MKTNARWRQSIEGWVMSIAFGIRRNVLILILMDFDLQSKPPFKQPDKFLSFYKKVKTALQTLTSGMGLGRSN